MKVNGLLLMKLFQIFKENKLFITESIDEAEFNDYFDFIDNYSSTFNSYEHKKPIKK